MAEKGKTLSRTASLNVIASALDYGARLVVGFLVSPILVRGLGDFLFGVWQVLGRIAGFMSIAGGRANQALKNAIANRQASTDYDEKRRLVASALAAWVLFLPLLLVLGGLAVWLAPAWVDAPADRVADVRFATAIVMANLIMLNLALTPRSVLQGENLLYKRMGLSAALILLGGGLMVLAVELGAGLQGVAAANLGRTLLAGSLFVPIVRRHVPWFGIARVTFKQVKDFLRLSSLFLVWRVVMQAMNASDVVVLGLLVSAEAVTSYSLTKYAPETIAGLVAIVISAVTPGLGGIIGGKDYAKARSVRGEMMAGTWLLATAIGGTVLLWNGAFVRLWVGPERYDGPLITLLITLMTVQLVLIRTDANVIDLTLKLGAKVTLGLASATISLILAVWLIGTVDNSTTGLLLGFIVGRALLSFAYPWLVGRALGIPLSRQLVSALRPAAVTAILFGGAALLGRDLSTTSLAVLVVPAASTFVGLLVGAYFMGLSTSQRRALLRRARTAVRREGK